MTTHNLTDHRENDDDSKYATEARKHDDMTGKVVKALSHSIAHRGTQAALENPKDGMERLLFMNEPRWKALTEKHTVDYCAWNHPYKNRRIFGSQSSGGNLQALQAMVDAIVTVTQVPLDLTLGDGDTLRYCQGQRAQGRQGRELRGKRTRYRHCY